MTTRKNALLMLAGVALLALPGKVVAQDYDTYLSADSEADFESEANILGNHYCTAGGSYGTDSNGNEYYTCTNGDDNYYFIWQQ